MNPSEIPPGHFMGFAADLVGIDIPDGMSISVCEPLAWGNDYSGQGVKVEACEVCHQDVWRTEGAPEGMFIICFECLWISIPHEWKSIVEKGIE